MFGHPKYRGLAWANMVVFGLPILRGRMDAIYGRKWMPKFAQKYGRAHTSCGHVFVSVLWMHTTRGGGRAKWVRPL